MPQAVMIQTENMSSVTAKNTAKASDTGEPDLFSNHFNQQLEQGRKADSAARPAREQDEGLKTEAATAEENETEIAADGNNLPAEETAVSDKQDTEHAANNEKSSDEAESADIDDAEKVAETSEQTPTIAAGSDDTAVIKGDEPLKPSDKPIRAQVSVSQQAVDHAKAAPVEMTAKTHPQQTVTSETQANKTGNQSASVTDAQKPQQPVVKNVSATVETSTEADSNNKKSDKIIVPNLATALKDEVESEAKTPRIRADILDALQRQQGKQETGMTVRNMIATQAQQSETDSKATINLSQILIDKRPADSGPQPLNSAVTLSSLVSSGQTTSQSAAAQTTLSLPVQPNMQNPAWGHVMSSRVVWMAREGVQQAELRMNPANMGPVEVKLHLHNDQASVTFHAQNAATRDALEQALPRLRESFAENGLQLADAQVGEQQQQQQDSAEQASHLQISSQARPQDDDIDKETDKSVSSVEVETGLSLYA